MNLEAPFEELLENLKDDTAPLRAAVLYRLSEPVEHELAALRDAWESVPSERRLLLLVRMVETSEASFDTDYTAVALFALDDPDEEVRSSAIEALWVSEDSATMQRLVRMLELDEAATVRAAAAQALGRFVLAGELGEIPEAMARSLEDTLLEAWENDAESLEVRRRALESIAYSGRDEVSSLIEEALDHADLSMQASALFAMGRCADERWADYVMSALTHDEPEIRFEAARAAGELGLRASVPRLIELTEDDDREVKEAAIWSLGEIGGQSATRALLNLSEHDDVDEALLDVIEDAMNTAALGSGEFATYILDVDDEIEPDD